MSLHEQLSCMTQWLRNSELTRLPDIHPNRLAIYRELVYNNIGSFIDVTFPVAQSILKEPLWTSLKQKFISEHFCQSPYFYEISHQFRQWVDESNLPDLSPFPWLTELLHVEWMELIVEIAPDTVMTASVSGDLAQASDPLLRPAVPFWVLAYHWPVHRWRLGWSNFEPEPVVLLIYRKYPELDIRMEELSAPEACVFDILSRAEQPGIHLSELTKNSCELLPPAWQVSNDQVRQWLLQREALGFRFQSADLNIRNIQEI